MSDPAVRRLADWDADRLRALADDHDTPLYVLDLERVRENYRRLDAAFPEARIHYAAKANTLGAILRTVNGAGAGVECASAGEVRRALDAGAVPEEIRYTAVNPPDGDLDDAVGIDGLQVVAGAMDTIDRLAERRFDGPLHVRVNPGIGAGHHEHVTTGADAKFGIPADRALDAIADADRRGFDVRGIHAHAGSGIMNDDLDAHRAVVARLGDLAGDSPVPLDVVDVGGGFGVPYRPEEAPLDLGAVADATREALGDVDARLAIEPGRYLVADAGVLLTRVNTVKAAAGVLGVDAGMTTLLRPALYDAYHHVANLASDAGGRPERTVTVTGPICESADVLAADRDLPAPERGDLLAVGNAGAYGEAMASQYNSRPRPATVVVDGDRTGVARDRETVGDIVCTEREVAWL